MKGSMVGKVVVHKGEPFMVHAEIYRPHLVLEGPDGERIIVPDGECTYGTSLDAAGWAERKMVFEREAEK